MLHGGTSRYGTEKNVDMPCESFGLGNTTGTWCLNCNDHSLATAPDSEV